MQSHELLVDAAVGYIEDGVGQAGELSGDVGKGGRAEHVAEHDAQ